MSSAPLRYRIVHHLPNRLRLRLPQLGAPGYAATALEAWCDALPGVTTSRVHVASQALIICFDPQVTSGAAIVAQLHTYAPVTTVTVPQAASPATTGIMTALLTLCLLPWLPRSWQLALTWLKIAPTLAHGARTLATHGVKVAVLDAVAIGLSAARGEFYTATLTDGLLALGDYLEQRTARQSDHLLQRLLQPAATQVWIERAGELVRVPDHAVQVGDIVQCGPGELVPIDGRVIAGVALVNQAAVTGEALPVRKEPYRRILAGSMICEGRVRIEVTQVGNETTSARIAQFIRAGLTQHSAGQCETERLADQRVAITLMTGATIYAFTRDIQRLQAVFLVDYACAAKLGTPIAIKAGMTSAAQHGILMRGGDAIEQLARVDTVVFDKTGTLTHSELAVATIEVLQPNSRYQATDLLALVASIEEHATHPIANAVVQSAKQRGLEHISHGEVEYLIAHGLNATVAHSGRVVVGSRHYLEAHEGIAFTRYEERIEQLQAAGYILLFVGNVDGPLGLIALRDTVRTETAATLARLRQLGIQRLIMLSGDLQHRATALGRELGFDQAYGEVAPEQKAQLLRQWQNDGAVVAFVGDGLNDGPALTAANVGIAMPHGADLARATADVVLMDDRLDAIADARELALNTMALIRSNFQAAVAINTAVLAGAVSGRLSPLASAVLHNGTTLAVLMRALQGVQLQSQQRE